MYSYDLHTLRDILAHLLVVTEHEMKTLQLAIFHFPLYIQLTLGYQETFLEYQ